MTRSVEVGIPTRSVGTSQRRHGNLHIAARCDPGYIDCGNLAPFPREPHGNWTAASDDPSLCPGLVDKPGDYAEAHVPEYWIVNPQTETITVLRLRGDAYEEAGIYRRGESAASLLLPGFSVAVAAVFDAD